MQRPKPIRRVELSPIDKFLERTCLALLLLSFGAAIVSYFFLPEEIIINYSGDKPDGVGGRIYVFLPIALGAFCYLLFTAISRYAYLLRNPKPVSAEKSLEQYRRSVRVMRIIKLALIASFSIELFETLRLTFKPSGGINWAVITVEILLIGIPAVYLLFLLLRSMRRTVFTKN
jgi:hypothetical protein